MTSGGSGLPSRNEGLLYCFYMSCPYVASHLKYCIRDICPMDKESTDTVTSNFWLKSNMCLKLKGVKVVPAAQAAVTQSNFQLIWLRLLN